MIIAGASGDGLNLVGDVFNTDMVYSLYDVCPTRKDILVVEGAGHGQSLYLDPEQYFDKVFGFISSL